MNRLSAKKHGMVKIFIRANIDRSPWMQRLAGKYTTKILLNRVRRSMAKRLKRRIKEIRYAPYEDGWIFLCDDHRIIFESRGGRSRGWERGEEWTVAHHELHREHPGYDE